MVKKKSKKIQVDAKICEPRANWKLIFSTDIRQSKMSLGTIIYFLIRF